MHGFEEFFDGFQGLFFDFDVLGLYEGDVGGNCSADLLFAEFVVRAQEIGEQAEYFLIEEAGVYVEGEQLNHPICLFLDIF